jgi:hypothetical protein
MPWLVLKLIGFGFPEKLAKPFIYAMLVVALVGGALFAKARYDAGIITNHDNKQAAKIEAKTIKVNEQADQQRRADDARANNESDQLGKVIDNAPKPTSPASSARQRYYECLRLWQRSNPSRSGSPPC